MPSVSGLLLAASEFQLSSYGLVVLTMLANHVHCVAPSIMGTGFPYSRQRGTALESRRCMLQGWHTLCAPTHWHTSYPSLPYPRSSMVPVTIPYTDGRAGR